MNILIVDDEPQIVTTLHSVLRALGHSCFEAVDGRTALNLVNSVNLDLVLLDLGLPDTDGIDLISTIRSKAEASIIVISARHLEADKIKALDQGADDYVDKPFGMDELLARVRVIERRRSEMEGTAARKLVSELLSVDFARREIVLMGEPIHLSPKEFLLFEILARNSGQVVTQRQLMIAGWDDPNVDTQYLRSYVALLRDKFEVESSDPELILTEPGVGYRLNIALHRSV